jgi:hypothetical protein
MATPYSSELLRSLVETLTGKAFGSMDGDERDRAVSDFLTMHVGVRTPLPVRLNRRLISALAGVYTWQKKYGEAARLEHCAGLGDWQRDILDMRVRLYDASSSFSALAMGPEGSRHRQHLQTLAKAAKNGDRGLVAAMLIIRRRDKARQSSQPSNSRLDYIEWDACRMMFPELWTRQFDLLTIELLDELSLFGLVAAADPGKMFVHGYRLMTGAGRHYQGFLDDSLGEPLKQALSSAPDALPLEHWVRKGEEFRDAKLHYRRRLASILQRTGNVAFNVNEAELNNIGRSGELVNLITELWTDPTARDVMATMSAEPLYDFELGYDPITPAEAVDRCLNKMIQVAEWLQASSSHEALLAYRLVEAYISLISQTFNLDA